MAGEGRRDFSINLAHLGYKLGLQLYRLGLQLDFSINPAHLGYKLGLQLYRLGLQQDFSINPAHLGYKLGLTCKSSPCRTLANNL